MRTAPSQHREWPSTAVPPLLESFANSKPILERINRSELAFLQIVVQGYFRVMKFSHNRPRSLKRKACARRDRSVQLPPAHGGHQKVDTKRGTMIPALTRERGE